MSAATPLRRLRGATPALGFGLALAMAPQPAAAHLVGVEFGDFYAGALHLLLAPEHVVAFLALGLIAATQPRERARWMLLALPLSLLAGAALSLVEITPPPLEPAIAATLLLVGLLGVAGLRLPLAALIALTVLVSIVHGYANGVSVRGESVDWRLYIAGVATAGTVLGSLLIAIASALIGLRSWTGIATRVLSSWIAAVGLMFLTLTLAA